MTTPAASATRSGRAKPARRRASRHPEQRRARERDRQRSLGEPAVRREHAPTAALATRKAASRRSTPVSDSFAAAADAQQHARGGADVQDELFGNEIAIELERLVGRGGQDDGDGAGCEEDEGGAIAGGGEASGNNLRRRTACGATCGVRRRRGCGGRRVDSPPPRLTDAAPALHSYRLQITLPLPHALSS